MFAAFFALLVVHALADYPQQGPYLSAAKNPSDPLGAGGVWVHALMAHSLIQGGGVALVLWIATGAWWLGLCEVLAHFVIDYAKCQRRISFHADQALHVACKVVWLGVACLVIR